MVSRGMYLIVVLCFLRPSRFSCAFFRFALFSSLKMNFNFGRFDWTGGSSPAPSLVTG